jgi:hypothetical protein
MATGGGPEMAAAAPSVVVVCGGWSPSLWFRSVSVSYSVFYLLFFG